MATETLKAWYLKEVIDKLQQYICLAQNGSYESFWRTVRLTLLLDTIPFTAQVAYLPAFDQREFKDIATPTLEQRQDVIRKVCDKIDRAYGDDARGELVQLLYHADPAAVKSFMKIS